MPPARSAFDIRVTVELDGRTLTMSAGELATLVMVPGLPARLLAFLRSPLGERGGGGRVGPASVGRPNDRTERSISISQPLSLVRGEGCRGEERGETRESTLRLAAYLADRLDDHRSLRFYERVTESVPPEVIREALVTTLDLPAASIRKSRAAYFTSLVRGHISRLGTKKFHANSKTPTP